MVEFVRMVSERQFQEVNLNTTLSDITRNSKTCVGLLLYSVCNCLLYTSYLIWTDPSEPYVQEILVFSLGISAVSRSSRSLYSSSWGLCPVSYTHLDVYKRQVL